MEKTKTFKNVKFSGERVKSGISKWREKLPTDAKIDVLRRRIKFYDESWNHDSDEEFFADFSKEYEAVYYSVRCFTKRGTYTFGIEHLNGEQYNEFTIEVSAPTRAEIEDVFLHLIETGSLLNCPK